jgi:hypothetical protein
MSAGESGKAGEHWVTRAIPCPNCQSKLTLLPPGFPLFDVQCSRCLFRAQVKTNRCRPKDQIFGAGWEILDKTLKTGQLIPPLLVNFEWSDKAGKKRHEVHFFPFLTKANIRRHKRSMRGQRPGYKQFNYVGLRNAPSVQLFPSSLKRRATSKTAARSLKPSSPA